MRKIYSHIIKNDIFGIASRVKEERKSNKRNGRAFRKNRR